MERFKTDTQTDLRYELQGDYYLIDGEDEAKLPPIGFWGQRHLRWLKQNRRVTYTKPGVEDWVRNELKQRFRPEFINRLDEIAFFRPLTGENLKAIVDLLFQDLKKRLAARGLDLSVTEAAKAYIVENGSDPQFGARPLKRYIQSHAESLLARYIIRESPEEGTELVLDADENGLKVR